MSDLSNQAKWYLGGSFPIHTGIVGHADPEPQAMIELVRARLVVVTKDILTNRKLYVLTEKGREAKETR